MIQLRLLGALDIDADGEDGAKALLGHPKRLALLAYLALRADHSPVSRDSLLAIFWPESDGSHARGALRNALHFLRSRLGRETIRSQGDRLTVEGIWCDGSAFEDLLERGQLEEGLELYRGDLLEGFYAADAPEFEAWLEEERGRLRRRAIDACWSLVDECERDGRSALAARYARRALGLAPTDEIGARRLFGLLAKAGDVTGALRAYDEFAERLDRLYEVAPSEETERLIQTIRRGAATAPGWGRHNDVAPRSAAPPPTRPDPGARDAPPPVGLVAGTTRPSAPPWARLSFWGAAAAMLLAIFLYGWGGTSAPAPTESTTSAETVVTVMPFSYEGAEALRFLGPGAARLVADGLNGAGQLRSVDARAIDAFVDRTGDAEGGALPDAVAAHFGAAYIVLGDVMEQDSTVHISVTLRRAGANPDEPAHTAMAEGPAADVFGLASELARALLQGLGFEGIERSAVRSGPPLSALKAFLRGETAARAGWYREALDEFTAAIREDSTFALAHYGRSAAAYGAGVADIPREAAAAARRHSAGLARPDQLFLEAWQNHLEARIPEAETFYRQVVAMQPTHVDAWHQLGELLFHWGPSAGIDPAAAMRPFEQVLALEPGDPGAGLHLARLLARAGEADSIRSLIAAAGDNATAAWTLELEALEAFSGSDRFRLEATTDAIVAARERVGTAILSSVANNASDLEATATLARRLLAPARGESERATVRALLVRIEVARGRLSQARRDVDEAPELPEATRRELAAALELLPFLSPDSARHATIEGLLADPSLDRPLPPQTDPVWLGSSAAPPLRWAGMVEADRLLLLGICQARGGRPGGAERIARLLERSELTEETVAYPALIRATIALEAGDAEAALAALGPPRRPPAAMLESLRDYARPLERWLRADALARMGRRREALRWFATFPNTQAADVWYAPSAALRRARLHDLLGERALAAAEYRKFLALVHGGEPHLDGQTREASDALDRLERAARD